MPCRVEPTQAELEAGRKAREDRLTAPLKKDKKQLEEDLAQAQDIIHALSARIDWLTEEVINFAGEFMSGKDYPQWIIDLENQQVDHRRQDLDRLLTSGTIKDPGLMRKVAAANPEYPLEPQLGFNPDDY